MPKTFSEIRDELSTLRSEIFEKGENVDPKQVASYVDRLVMAVENLAESLELMEADMEAMGKCCESCGEPPPEMKCACPCCCEPMAMPAKAKPKKAAKKARKAKPAKKKKRR